MFRLATLFVDVVTNQGNFDASMMSMRGALGPMISLTQRMAEQGSKLFETMNKVDVTFGKSRGTVVAMANDMAARFGTVKGVSLDAAANVGLIGQAAGMTEDQSAKLAVQMTKLADDASSFFNVPMDQALEKIRAGLVGQVRPLREFGVLLSKSAVDHELLSMGVKKVHGEFTEQEKVMARVEIITRGLAKAQGDHERTMGSYVNQMRKMNGEVENFRTGIGAGISGGEAQFLVNVRDKGIMGAIGSHGTEVFKQLFGNKDTTFQAAADVAAGLEVGIKGIGDETAKPKAYKKPTRDFAMESWLKMLDDGAKRMEDKIAEQARAALTSEFQPMDYRTPAQAAKEKADEAHKKKTAAQEENKFMEKFLGLDIPEAGQKHHHIAQAMGAAEFASKLRMEQGGGDVPVKQLTELQQIRKQEEENGKMFAQLLDRSFAAVLG